METSVSATDANRNFSHLLGRTEEGERYVITAHGRPVAKLTPFEDKNAEVRRAKAYQKLLRHLKSEAPVKRIGTWTRDELYED